MQISFRRRNLRLLLFQSRRDLLSAILARGQVSRPRQLLPKPAEFFLRVLRLFLPFEEPGVSLRGRPGKVSLPLGKHDFCLAQGVPRHVELFVVLREFAVLCLCDLFRLRHRGVSLRPLFLGLRVQGLGPLLQLRLRLRESLLAILHGLEFRIDPRIARNEFPLFPRHLDFAVLNPLQFLFEVHSVLIHEGLPLMEGFFMGLDFRLLCGEVPRLADPFPGVGDLALKPLDSIFSSFEGGLRLRCPPREFQFLFVRTASELPGLRPRVRNGLFPITEVLLQSRDLPAQGLGLGPRLAPGSRRILVLRFKFLDSSLGVFRAPLPAFEVFLARLGVGVSLRNRSLPADKLPAPLIEAPHLVPEFRELRLNLRLPRLNVFRPCRDRRLLLPEVLLLAELPLETFRLLLRSLKGPLRVLEPSF